MAVYVDNMRAPFRGKLFCHMIADTSVELDVMAKAIGLKPEWKQKSGSHNEHYDISMSMRQRAIDLGAIELSMKDLVRKMVNKRSDRRYLTT